MNQTQPNPLGFLLRLGFGLTHTLFSATFRFPIKINHKVGSPMKDRRELLKGLAVGSVWATPVVSSVVLPVHAETSGEASSTGFTTVTFTHTSTLADGTTASGYSSGESVSIEISFASTALENQTFTADDIISFVWTFSSRTVTVNNTGSSWSSSAGSFQTDGAGAITSVPSNWFSAPANATESSAQTVDMWFMNGGNLVMQIDGNPVNMNNADNNIISAFWTVSTS